MYGRPFTVTLFMDIRAPVSPLITSCQPHRLLFVATTEAHQSSRRCPRVAASRSFPNPDPTLSFAQPRLCSNAVRGGHGASLFLSPGAGSALLTARSAVPRRLFVSPGGSFAQMLAFFSSTPFPCNGAELARPPCHHQI